MPAVWSPTPMGLWSNTPTATTQLYYMPRNMTVTASTTAGTWVWYGTPVPNPTYVAWSAADTTTGDGQWRWLTPPALLLPVEDQWHAMGLLPRVRQQREQERVASPAIIRERSEEVDRRAREAIARRHEQIQQAEAATARAQELLLEHLTPEQRTMFERNKWFVIEGKQRYRIRADRGVVANIDVLDRNGRVLHRLCGHCDHTVPFGDQLLAQKMMLEFSEDDFLRIANRHGA